MRKIFLYTYHIDEERFSQTSNLMLERETVNIEGRNEHELIFAIGNSHMHQIRIAVASGPGKVYYDSNSATYRVWFDGPDRDKAIEAIGNYILDRVAPEIRNHKSFIERLEKERARAFSLLEKIPEV